jgi:hypothetical protein
MERWNELDRRESIEARGGKQWKERNCDNSLIALLRSSVRVRNRDDFKKALLAQSR